MPQDINIEHEIIFILISNRITYIKNILYNTSIRKIYIYIITIKKENNTILYKNISRWQISYMNNVQLFHYTYIKNSVYKEK